MKNRDKQSHTDYMTAHHVSDVVTWVSIGCISGVAYTTTEAESRNFSTSPLKLNWNDSRFSLEHKNEKQSAKRVLVNMSAG